ncbi:unnamed protein product [Bemisia tabaci]|uniref:FYVE-type domain-containing protein n=1 Tax=Bemisia tabaci TaxID=7038 RepID=A0A9P0A5P8_BEMTA|nr:unnamed protein product [Bemisia tabaci]
MEKFAVDLEKVLDDFEIDEEKEELLTLHTVNRAASFPQPRQNVSVRPPAASYRRPSFEPINLAEADFAASPQSTTVHNYNEEYYNSTLYCQKDNLRNGNSVYSKLISKSNQSDASLYSRLIPEQNISLHEKSVINSGESNWNININPAKSTPSDDNASYSNPYIHSIIKTSQLKVPLEYEAPPPYSLLPPPEVVSIKLNHETALDEKPDLIDTKKFSEATNSHEEFLDSKHSHLPDVAASGQNCKKSISASTFSSQNVTLDLINSSSVINSALNAESPHTSSNAPIGFNTLHNVSDSELEQYLHELDELEDDTTDDCSLILHDSVTNNLEALGANVEKFERSETVPLNISTEEDFSNEAESSVVNTSDSQNLNIHYNIQCDSNNDVFLSSSDASFVDSATSSVREVNESGGKSGESSFNRTVSEVVDFKSEETGDNVILSSSHDRKALFQQSVESTIITNDPMNGTISDVRESSEISFDKKCTKMEEVSTSSIHHKNTNAKSDLSSDSQICNTDRIDSGPQVGNNFEEKDTSRESYNGVEAQEINENLANEAAEDETTSEASTLSASSFSGECVFEEFVKPVHQSEVEDQNNLLSICLDTEKNQNTLSDIESNVVSNETSMYSEATNTIDENVYTNENCTLELSGESRPVRPNSLQLSSQITVSSDIIESGTESNLEASSITSGEWKLGKSSPYWVPDSETLNCMRCETKFTLIRRRHHCRACGLLLCSKCCSMKTKLEYMEYAEARVCQQCYSVLEKGFGPEPEQSPSSTNRPNPNNPMEYCSTIPPLQQAASALHQPPPSVLVPVGVLKREGRTRSETPKQVIFSDGIRPGGDLTELDDAPEPRLSIKRQSRQVKMKADQHGDEMSCSSRTVEGVSEMNHRKGSKHKLIKGGLCRHNSSYVEIGSLPENILPRIITREHGETQLTDLEKPITLEDPPIKFAINPNLLLVVKRLFLDCCVNKEVWCFTTEGLACVCQDEIVFVIECLPDEEKPPKDIFLFVNSIYKQAPKGIIYSELSFASTEMTNFLGSKDHGGFLFIRTSYQCVNKLLIPPAPYLIGLLIHRWEAPWAKLFPIRLMLRYGAEYRYYPCYLVSVRFRHSLYFDIGTTIIRFLADFRKFEYTLSSVRGLKIHMEDRQTSILLPRNRYDQVIKAINNSNDSVLAFSGNFSYEADSHFVCMQNNENESYFTQAIYINSRPRKITGASFVVFNGALKPCGLTGKSVLVEDGFMVYIPSESMTALRNALKDMKDYSVGCGENSEVVVLLKWSDDDTHFNVGVKSVIDGKSLDGIPSIRVHNGTDFFGNSRLIRWTEVFIFHSEEDIAKGGDSIDVSRLSESIAQATCKALVPLLDLLASVSLYTLALRVSIHPDKVGYEAGSCNEKLPPLYMKRLDDGLIPLLHQAAIKNQDSPTTLELVFRVMEQT